MREGVVKGVENFELAGVDGDVGVVDRDPAILLHLFRGKRYFEAGRTRKSKSI